jgi:hypothetical protein
LQVKRYVRRSLERVAAKRRVEFERQAELFRAGAAAGVIQLSPLSLPELTKVDEVEEEIEVEASAAQEMRNKVEDWQQQRGSRRARDNSFADKITVTFDASFAKQVKELSPMPRPCVASKWSSPPPPQAPALHAAKLERGRGGPPRGAPSPPER